MFYRDHLGRDWTCWKEICIKRFKNSVSFRAFRGQTNPQMIAADAR
jgi:hypothetical protein